MMSGRALRSQGNDVSTHQHTRTHTHGFTHSPAPVHSLVSHFLSHTPCLRGDSTLQQIFSSHRWDWSVRALVKLTSKLTRRAQSLRCPHFSTTSSGWAQKSAVSEQQLFQTVRLFFLLSATNGWTPLNTPVKKKITQNRIYQVPDMSTNRWDLSHVSSRADKKKRKKC